MPDPPGGQILRNDRLPLLLLLRDGLGRDLLNDRQGVRMLAVHVDIDQLELCRGGVLLRRFALLGIALRSELYDVVLFTFPAPSAAAPPEHLLLARLLRLPLHII